MWWSHVLIAATVALLVRGDDVAGSADCTTSLGSSYASWFPWFSSKDMNTGTALPTNTSMVPLSLFQSLFPFMGWNTTPPPANGAPGSAPALSFDYIASSAPDVDQNSVEQQAPETPAVPAADEPVIPTTPTIDTTETPDVQLTDYSESPPAQPPAAGSPPSITFDSIDSSAPDVDQNSVEQQAPETPAVPAADEPVIPSTPTTDTTETPDVQLTDNSESPPVQPPAAGSPPSITFDSIDSSAPDVDQNSVEQQAPETPAVPVADEPVIPTTPTTDTTETPDVQLTDNSESPPVQPTEAPKATAAPPVATAKPPTADAPSSTVKPARPSNVSRTASSDNSKLCAKMRVKISAVDLGVNVDSNEDEVALKVVAIAALPSGGSRVAVHSADGVIVLELDENDKLVSTSAPVKVPVHDFADIYADEKGFVLLGTRDAEGGGTLNCGNPSNLCGAAPNPSVPCYDMFLIRYDGSTETWAAKLTSSSTSLPPYSSSKTGPDVYMIWWYAHHGRIASDGTNWAAYFGCAISTSQDGCINIHQGDRMKVVDPSGQIMTQSDAFDWGCSHSGYERVMYDSRKDGYTSICKTDNKNRIIPPNDWSTTIYPVDLAASNLGDIVADSQASSGKYWASVSNGEGDNAKVHLIHFAINAAADNDITIGGTDANERAPHLARIGEGGLLALWEGSSTGGDLVEGGDRNMYAQVLDASTGKTISSKVTVDKTVVGNRYQALKSFPDGSVVYLSKGTTDTSVQVVRFYGC